MELTLQSARPARRGVEYSVWAPKQDRVAVVIGGRTVSLKRGDCGRFGGVDAQGRAGDRYKFQLGENETPDPGAHFLPEGVHGPAEVIDHNAFQWPRTERDIRRPALNELVIYEMHVGAFTKEGTFRSAIEKLPHLRELGATAIHVMPIADFAGRRNWGYDGVSLYAVSHDYGRPDDFKAFVAAAHREGLAVILDVVYNHFGPDGNYLETYSKDYFSTRGANLWGKNINFDGANSDFVRAFFIANAIHWMEHYHVDGFRLDATHAIIDKSQPHVLTEIAHAVRQRGGFTIAEDERNWNRLVQADGMGIDAVWADDFHHVVKVALTGEKFAHFTSYDGTGPELLDTLRNGWLFRGQAYKQTGKARGSECSMLATEKFVYCISNHDQAGNRPLGERLNHLISGDAYAAASALLCCVPYTPMLFMGQEFAASTPFCFFTDHQGEIGKNVSKGRLAEFKHYKANFSEDILARMPDPQLEKTFLDSKLNWDDLKDPHRQSTLNVYREFLKFRRERLTPEVRKRGAWRVELWDGDIVAIHYGKILVISDLKGGHPCNLPKGKWRGLLSSTSRTNWTDINFDRPETIVLERVE